MDYQDLWTKACEQLKSVLSQSIYSCWIEIIEPRSLHENTFELCVDNDFCKDWLSDNYSDYIKDALKSVGASNEINLNFVVETCDEDPVTKKQSNHKQTTQNKEVKKGYKPPRPRRKIATTALNPNFTFENFVTGSSNSFAHSAALGVSQSPGRAYNPLFIYGQTGIGKTHLMQAIGHRVLDSPNILVSYVSSETLLNEFVESLKDRTTAKFRNKYRKTDILLVDDIQFLAKMESLQEEFFHTFNVLYDAHKQIIMTSDLPPRDLANLEPRLKSRFEWGLVTEIESPDFETRLAILRYKLSLSNTRIADDLLFYIADNIKSNVRSLEGALTRVISFTSLNNNTSIDIDTVRGLLKDLLSEETFKDLSFEEIQRSVANHFNLRMTDMSSKRRHRSVVVPRQIAMFICRKLTRSSLPEIADAFGKTHPTVKHACETVQNRMQVEEDTRSLVREIVRQLGRNPENFNI